MRARADGVRVSAKRNGDQEEDNEDDDGGDWSLLPFGVVGCFGQIGIGQICVGSLVCGCARQI